GMYYDTPIDKYIPKNTDEVEIITLINRFHKASMDHDLGNYLACLNKKGSFMFSGTRMISKDELTALLPQFWSDLKSGDMLARAMCRESLNGNFFKGSLYDPLITLEGHKASASVKFVTPIIRWKTLLFIDFLKQEEILQISRFEWDMG
ncbi:MAG: hypothetical protein MI892_31470, partial [Desulfobacterales bacterium]|nr:hypothetical protein [Desulfobacterales bacterium]